MTNMLPTGTVLLRHYRLTERVRSGEFVETYTAVDIRTDQEVTIDVLDAQEPALRSLVTTGYTASARVVHSAVARIEAISSDDQLGIFVLEALGETSLSDVIRVSRMSPRAVALLASELCAGIARFHDLNLIHRDIRPHNIFLRPDGHGGFLPKLAGFHIASTMDESPRNTNALVGAPEYMSPEALRGQRGSPSDIFAIGITIFETLTGKRLRKGNSLAELAFSEPQPSRYVAPELDHDLARIIDRCVNTVPQYRPTAVQLADLLASLAERMRPPTVVILYAVGDRPFAEELRGHFRTMEREHVVSTWALDDILPGDNFESALLRHARHADILVPLLSAEFLASDLFWSIMNWARHRAKWLMPVLLRACAWENMPFCRGALPSSRVPVTSMPHRDAAWSELAERIREVLQPSNTLHSPTPPSSRRHAIPIAAASLPEEYRSVRFDCSQKFPVRPPDAVGLVCHAIHSRSITIVGSRDVGAELLAAMIFNSHGDGVWMSQQNSTSLARPAIYGSFMSLEDKWLFDKLRSSPLLVLVDFGACDASPSDTAIIHERLFLSRQAAGLQTVVVTNIPWQGFVYFYGIELAQLVFDDAVIELDIQRRSPGA